MSTSAEARGADRDDPGSAAAAEPESPEAKPPPVTGARSDVTVDVAAAVRHPVDGAWIHARLNAAVGRLERPVQRVSVMIVDDRRMTELHERFLGVTETTDVLTFPGGDAAGGVVDADIAVCADEAARQAHARGHALERELLLYALHGVLHCVGFDDRTEESFRVMHAEEDRLLRAIGEPATFRPAEERTT